MAGTEYIIRLSFPEKFTDSVGGKSEPNMNTGIVNPPSAVD